MSVAARSSSAAARGQPLAVGRRSPLEHPVGRGEAQLERVDGVEEVLLVLLHVLVVGQRQRRAGRRGARQVAGDARRLGPQQLGGVGVLLLRHDRGARRPRVGDLAEAELLARPQHDLGAEPREVRRAGGGGRRGSRARSRGWRRRRSSSRRDAGEAELARDAAAGRCRSSRPRARPRRAAGAPPRLDRGEPVAVADRASRRRRAGDGRGRPAGRAGGGCSPASASRGGARRAPTQRPGERARIAPRRCARASRTNSATSVATWSLRERAVWSLPPTGPASSVTRRSIAMWMSSSSVGERERALAELALDLRRAPRAARRARRSEMIPCAASIARARATAATS